MLFFCLNGSIALYTAILADLDLWALYNGLLAYIAMGVLFSIEYLIRIRVRNRT